MGCSSTRARRIKKEDIEYIVEAQLMSNVRGHRYQFQQLDDLEKLLAPHSDKLIEVYGETADSIIEGLRKLEISLSSGKLDSLNDFISDYEAFQRKAEGKTFDEVEALLEEKRQSHTVQDYLSKCFGTDLYDVKKVTNWDDRLIESLSWSIGENMDLFQKTEYPGWPIQDLPVQKRPLLRLKILCTALIIIIFSTIFIEYCRKILRSMIHYMLRYGLKDSRTQVNL